MIEILSRRNSLNIDRLGYEKDGFTIVKNPLESGEVESIAAEVERLHINFPELKKECSLLVSLGPWCIKHPHLVSGVIRNYLFSETYSEICRVLIGSDVNFYWATTAHKPPVKGKAFPWHQDAGYGKGPLEYLTCWAALDDVDEENGCIWAIPGSHHWEILPHEFRKSDENDYGGVFLKSEPLDTSNAMPVRLRAGDIVCLNSKVIHETKKNCSGRKRRGLIAAYASVQAFEGHVLGPDELPETLLRGG